MAYQPISFAYTLDGSVPAILRAPEKSAQTFQAGTPVELVSGYVKESTFGAGAKQYGIAVEGGHNLSADGAADELSVGTPPNQPNAKIIPVGAPVKDGKLAVYLANGLNVFSANLKTGQTYSDSLLGGAGGIINEYDLVKDGTTGIFYIDTANVNTGNPQNCVRILGRDPRTPNTSGEVRVFFMFSQADRYWP